MGELFEKLGLTLEGIIWHASALVLLIVAFRFLLFKPLKQMVDKRREAIDTVYNENRRLNAEALEVKRGYEKMLADTRLEVARLAEESTAAAEAKSAEIVAEARRHAAEIIAAAENDTEAERTRLANEFRSEVTALSVDIAEAILSREVRAADNSRIISEALSAWSED